MQVTATAKVKIQPTSEIIETIKTYSQGLQYCVDTAWEMKIKNNIKLHYIVYPYLRNIGLHSKLAIACIKQVLGIVKIGKTKSVIKKDCVRYNFPRSASVKNNVLSLATNKGRIKMPFTVPACYQGYFNNLDWQVKESLLYLDKQGRCFFLFTFSKHVEPVKTGKSLGIDLGINNLAVTSNNIFYKSSATKQVKRKFRYLRSRLQAKGTRASKNLLRKISGREKRFMAWINHNISKQIVSASQGSKIVMENLKGIRKINRGKTINYWISNWSFYQLQSFIRYKAERLGIEVISVNPIYTSQICHRCGHKGSRSKGMFNCNHCGLSNYNSDLNASRNLAHPKLVERQGCL